VSRVPSPLTRQRADAADEMLSAPARPAALPPDELAETGQPLPLQHGAYQ
jgi:hypothetical protein